MKVELQEQSHSNVTCFGHQARVTIRGIHSYRVKWFLDGEELGWMDLGGGNWGSFPNAIGNWKMEFWQGDNLVGIYSNDLESTDILIILNLPESKPGKVFNIASYLDNRKAEIEGKYKCNVVFYFENCEKYALSEDIKTLKLNDNYDEFSLIIEEDING